MDRVTKGQWKVRSKASLKDKSQFALITALLGKHDYLVMGSFIGNEVQTAKTKAALYDPPFKRITGFYKISSQQAIVLSS
jgi:hypothetical protein